jgi:hypothetical protein
MFAAIPAAAAAAAPHVGSALVAGAKGLVALTVAQKATRIAKGQVDHLLDDLTTAKVAARLAQQERKNIQLRDTNVA